MSVAAMLKMLGFFFILLLFSYPWIEDELVFSVINTCSRVGRRGPRAPPDGKISMVPRGPYHYQVYGNTCYQVQKYPHGVHLALYRDPKAQFWEELGQMSQCHINRFEWSCNISKWGFSTMLSTMVTFLFWLGVSVIKKSKMAATRYIGFCRRNAYGCW